MAEKRQESGFTVTDRRLFTEDGELRKDISQESEKPKIATPPPAASQAAPPAPVAPFPAAQENPQPEIPPMPTADEQQVQADAYRKSSSELDSRVELSGHSAKEFEMTFERFMASLYMTAMMQLGLMHQQGEQPRVDIIGARQTIDTLALLAEKTKRNLTPTEENFLQNSLYEVRMAYVEVTNALSRPPQPGAATGTTGR
jgi:type IV secretory pathway VirB10-like protein